jgi:hypothetical protein
MEKIPLQGDPRIFVAANRTGNRLLPADPVTRFSRTAIEEVIIRGMQDIW